MKVRIVGEGWQHFTGSMGHQAEFVDGVSVGHLNARQVARIGSSFMIVDDETGLQIGPAQAAMLLQSRPIEPPPAPVTLDVVKVDEENARAALLKAEAERKQVEKEALAAATVKAAEKKDDDVVIYTRAELEAIAANNGITGLREIAEPLKVKGRAIAELVEEILTAQSKRAVV